MFPTGVGFGATSTGLNARGVQRYAMVVEAISSPINTNMFICILRLARNASSWSRRSTPGRDSGAVVIRSQALKATKLFGAFASAVTPLFAGDKVFWLLLRRPVQGSPFRLCSVA